MNILVIGSTGASGRAVTAELLGRGHKVTAFARTPSSITEQHDALCVVQGDAMNQDDLERAVDGHDAVVVTLGITENPLMVRLRGTRGTPLNIRSAGTDNVVAAMKAKGVKRLIVQTTYGVGESRDRLPLKWRMIFSLLLKPQIQDTERQEDVVRRSGLDWSLVQPVGLNDGDEPEEVEVKEGGAELGGMAVSRKSVARVIADAVGEQKFTHRSVGVAAC